MRLVRTSGRPIAEIAGELGIHNQTLRGWVYAAQAVGDSDQPAKDDRTELARLRRRVRVLEQERDILKKAAAWFAKESGSTP